MILLGGSIMGFGLAFFLVPTQITAGGVSGIATVLHYLFNLPVGFMVLVINIPIFILGFVNFNAKFLLSSVFGTMALSLSTQIFELDFFNALLPISNDMLLCSVFGGVIYGLGLGLTMRYGGTTGGTDILSLVFKKWFPSMSIGQLFIAIDGVIIIFAGIAFKSLETILYSIVMLFVSSHVLDTILDGVDFAKIIYIISEKNTDISKGIANELKRGSTVLSGYSFYSRKSRGVLMCVMRKHQVPRLKNLVTSIDPNAFVVVSDAKEVIGRGFKISNAEK